jgi:hypothetical protein
MVFLEASREARDAAAEAEQRKRLEELRRSRRMNTILAIAFLVSVASGGYAWLARAEMKKMQKAFEGSAAATAAVLKAQVHLADAQSRTDDEAVEEAKRALTGALVTAAAAAAMASGGEIVEFSSNRPDDLFDVSRGVRVIDQSDCNQCYGMFGDQKNGPGDKSATFFKDIWDKGIRSERRIEWRTAEPVTLASVALFAAHDHTGSGQHRAFSKFELYARARSGKWQVVKTYAPTLPYGGPKRDEYDLSATLAVCLDVPRTTAQEFAAVFTQATGGGPRVIGLDGYTASKCKN